MDYVDVHVDVDVKFIVLLDLRERGLVRNWGRTAKRNYYNYRK